jgi:hypothetical protein
MPRITPRRHQPRSLLIRSLPMMQRITRFIEPVLIPFLRFATWPARLLWRWMREREGEFLAKRIRKTFPVLFLYGGAEIVSIRKGRPGTVVVKLKGMLLEFTAHHEIVYVRVAPVTWPQNRHELDLVLCAVEGRPLNREPFIGLADLSRRFLPHLDSVDAMMTGEAFFKLGATLGKFYGSESPSGREPN